MVGQSVFEIYRDNQDVLMNIRRALAGETFSRLLMSGTGHLKHAIHH